MRIGVTNATTAVVFYLNFDLIVEFSFHEQEDGTFFFAYSSKVEDDCFDRMRVTEEEKNRILNKLDLL